MFCGPIMFFQYFKNTLVTGGGGGGQNHPLFKVLKSIVKTYISIHKTCLYILSWIAIYIYGGSQQGRR